MKFVSPSHEVSLAMVRHLSEHAVNKPWSRQLRCTTRPRPSLHRDVPVFQPWVASATAMWRGFAEKPAEKKDTCLERTWVNPTFL